MIITMMFMTMMMMTTMTRLMMMMMKIAMIMMMMKKMIMIRSMMIVSVKMTIMPLLSPLPKKTGKGSETLVNKDKLKTGKIVFIAVLGSPIISIHFQKGKQAGFFSI